MVGKKKKSKSSTSLKDTSTSQDPNFYSGAGEFTLPNGDVYAGDYCAHRSGLIWREGHGVYQTQDGQTYEGKWHDDKLVEGKEVMITYPNGAQYCGALLKSKYNGPGTYNFESNMSMSCDFVGNKPTGMISLVDREGILWRGIAKENSALLLPENIFYLNLTEDRGKGLSKEPFDLDAMYPSTSTVTNENKEEELSDREWEKIIFAKSKLTTDDTDFTACKWWTNYDEFKEKYDEIKTKIADDVSLEQEDYLWIERFKKYKRKQQMKKELKKLRWKKEEERLIRLNEKFRSKDFNESCPPVNVIYPRDVWEDLKDKSKLLWTEQQSISSDLLTTRSENIIIVGSDGNLVDKPMEKAIIDAQIIEIASAPSGSLQSISSSSDNQMVQFNKLVQHSDKHVSRIADGSEQNEQDKASKSIFSADEPDEFELHFTPFREEMLLDKQNELKKLEDLMTDKVPSKATSKSDQDFKMSRQDSKVKKCEIPIIPKSETETDVGSRTQLPAATSKHSKREDKVRKCIREFLAQRGEKHVEKQKVSVGKHAIAHTHNVAAHTESLTGIPRELLLKKSLSPP